MTTPPPADIEAIRKRHSIMFGRGLMGGAFSDEEIQAAFEDRATLLSLLSRPAARGGDDLWQPIETAPRDGTSVLVCRGPGEQVYESYIDQEMFGNNTWIVLGRGHVGTPYKTALVGSGCPLWWRPLPAFSETASAERDGVEALRKERDRQTRYAKAFEVELDKVWDALGMTTADEEYHEAAARMKARAETAESALAEARAEIKALEAGIEQEIAARDFAQDCLQQAHIRLGGDGEWTAKPGQIVQPPNTGDLHYDVPALAADVLERAVVAESALEAAQVKVAEQCAQVADNAGRLDHDLGNEYLRREIDMSAFIAEKIRALIKSGVVGTAQQNQ